MRGNTRRAVKKSFEEYLGDTFFHYGDIGNNSYFYFFTPIGQMITLTLNELKDAGEETALDQFNICYGDYGFIFTEAEAYEFTDFDRELEIEDPEDAAQSTNQILGIIYEDTIKRAIEEAEADISPEADTQVAGKTTAPDEDSRFQIFLNCLDSHLYYKNEQAYSYEELVELIKNDINPQPECKAQ